jgi:CRP-like cAMP-binding protein
MSELEHYIQTNFGVDADKLEKISSFFTPITLEKGAFYLKAGHYSERLGFVQSGILREFTTMGDKDITKWISTKGYFAVDLYSFYFGHPARWNMQALTDCELHVIDLKAYKEIKDHIPEWPELEKLFISKCFSALEDRIVQSIAFSAEERYAEFFNRNKEIFNRVPLQYIASMLGMTPETLSRLRKKSKVISS